MIALKKEDIPAILAKEAQNWTTALTTKLNSGKKPTNTEKTRYRHPDIKQALIKETHGKCAYCESKILHVSPGDVEHIFPKSKRPELTFEWNNLTLACTECNRRKDAEDFCDSKLFVDPYKVDPVEHFWFAGPAMIPVPGNDAAHATWKKLELNREKLFGVRQEAIEDLRVRLSNIAKTLDPDARAILIAETLEEASAKKEFSAMARDFVSDGLRRLGY